MTYPEFLSANNGSDWNESGMSEADWQLRGHQQAMAMANGLPWQLSNADSSGNPTGGDLDGDWTDLEHANSFDRIDDEYFEAEVDRDAWRAIGCEPPDLT